MRESTYAYAHGLRPTQGLMVLIIARLVAQTNFIREVSDLSTGLDTLAYNVNLAEPGLSLGLLNQQVG